MVRYYNELTRLEMEQVDKDETVVMIPVGALEQHGNQCPLGTDEIIAEGTARRIKEALDREIPDYPMLIFPLIPVGLSTEHVNFCGSVTLKPDTFYHVLYDICKGLAHHGFKKIAVLNCHGGNSPIIQVLSRELRSELGIAVFIINCGAFFGNQAVNVRIPFEIPAKSMKNHDITGSEVFGFVHFKEHVGNNTAAEWKRQ